MSWKTSLHISDLDPEQRLEATCKECGHVHFITPAQVLRQGIERGFLYVDELERETICKTRGCRGQVRLAMVRSGETSGFVGGLA